MTPLQYYLLILLLITLIIICLIIAAVYKYRYNICFYNPSPWCYKDWQCQQTTPNVCTPDPNCAVNGSCYVNECECKNPNKPADQLECILKGCQTIYTINGQPGGATCTPNATNTGTCLPSYNPNTCMQPFYDINKTT